MTSFATLRALVRLSIRRRFHPLTRIGYNTARTSSSNAQTYFGLTLIGLGWFLKRSKKQSLLYAVDVKRGKTVELHVLRGTSVLAETTVVN